MRSRGDLGSATSSVSQGVECRRLGVTMPVHATVDAGCPAGA